MRNVGGGHRNPSADRRIGSLGVQVCQDLLKTEVGRFLKHQLIRPEKSGIYLQDDNSGVFVLVLYPESILDMTDLRNCT